MSQILGTLLDSAGNPLTGKLRVSLTGTLVNTTPTPDAIHLAEPYLFTITSGAIDINLQESETSKVTYRFEFFRTDGGGELIEPALLDFYALVPNASPIQFASLTPTGMVNDVLDTGALRVATIIATNPNLASSIGGPFPKGTWSVTTTYNYRDLVVYLNRTYISKSITPITGILPTDTTYWMNIPVEPNGSLILGDATPYGVAWNSSGLATSQDAVYDAIQTINTNISLKANIASPAFTGNPTATTQSTSENSTRIATTAYVKSNLTSYATLASPTFTGDAKAVTPTAFDNDTSIATTAFVQSICRPAFSVNSSTSQTASTPNTLVNFNIENLDTNGAFASNVFTVPSGAGGKYLFGGAVFLTNNSTITSQAFGVYYYKNGAISLLGGQAIIPATNSIIVSISPVILTLNAGDTLGLAVTNFSSSISYTIGLFTDPNNVYFWGFRLPV